VSFRPLLLAQKWTPKVDPSGYWLSPKLDGIRAYWDGEGTLWSRLGKPFVKAPAEYLALLPRGVPLDGELYLGPGRFNDTVRAVKGHAGWGELRYVVFDAPHDVDTFERRIAVARRFWHDVAEQTPCAGHVHLQAELAEAEDAGLEGIMLRKPGSLYEGKRSRTLLKVKTFQDCEAKVTAVYAGKGKHAGRMGYLTCELESGVTVDVGTGFTDDERADAWQDARNVAGVGGEPAHTWLARRITIRYQELTPAGVPRFPSFVCRRDYE
jgi:DNA ligase 1